MPGSNSNSQINSTELEKTTLLLALANLCLAPIYCVSNKLGLMASVAVTGGALYQLNELGKSRRPVSNVFFSSSSADPNGFNNTVQNIVNGGAHVADSVASSLSKGGK